MIHTRLRRAGGALVVAVACAALTAAPALASADQLSIIEDEHQMLELGPAAQAAALNDAQALGADAIRANVIWSHFAPAARSRHRPKRFDGKNPNAYGSAFALLDSLVANAQARGFQVLLTPTGPGPAWASRCGGSAAKRQPCNPDPKQFGAFVRALGARYPSVKMWSIWNEPNERAWLSPQVSRGTLQSPSLYRALARSAIAGLRATGHRGDQVMLGETAPIKGAGGSSPEAFLRDLFCINAKGRRLTGGAAAAQHCSHYRRLAVTAYAHHPYTRGGSRPPTSRPNPGEITVGTASRLTRILDQAAHAGRIPRNLPIYYTENGWQTNPPDRIFGVTLAQQAAYINQSDAIAYRNPRVKSVAQYQIVDDASLGSFQTGLRFLNGTKKPSYDAYRLPIWVSRSGSGVRIYGQVRTAPDSAALQVEVRHAASPGAAFQTVQTVPVTSLKGQFTVTIPGVGGGVWQLRSNGLTSRQAGVGT
jgi:Cellulase (glycosyl hydrolase family 5)